MESAGRITVRYPSSRYPSSSGSSSHQTVRTLAVVLRAQDDILTLLEGQHRVIERLIDDVDNEDQPALKERLLEHLADAITIHFALEERHLYLAFRDDRTDDVLADSRAANAAMTAHLTFLLTHVGDPTFDARFGLLREGFERHIADDEHELFPKVQTILPPERRRALGRVVRREGAELGRARLLLRMSHSQ